MYSLKKTALNCLSAFLAGMASITIFPTSASGTDYYVSQADGSDSYSGLSPTYQGGINGPWETIHYALQAVSSGDAINILNGEYREGVVANGKSGAPDQYIIIQNYPGHTPVVNGAVDYSGTEKWTHYQGQIYYTTGIDWPTGLVIQDDVPLGPGMIVNKDRSEESLADVDNPGEFYHDEDTSLLYMWAFGGGNPGQYKTEISKDKGLDLQPPSAYIKVKGLIIKNCMRENAGGGIQICDYGIIEDCIIYNSRWGIVNAWDPAQDIQVLNNEFYQCGDGMISWDAPGGLIKGNYAHNNWDDGISFRKSRNFIVEENICSNNEGGGPAGNEGDGIKVSIIAGEDFAETASRDMIVRNNLCYNNLNDAIFIKGYNIQVYNNTMYGGKNTFVIGGSDLTIKNNIIGGRLTTEQLEGFDSIEMDYNVWYREEGFLVSYNWTETYHSLEDFQNASGCDAHSIHADPQFVNPDAGNFRLLQISPAIDAGVAVDGVNNDLDGTTRPQGNGFDIGAYEFEGETDTTPPNSPTGLNSPNQTFNSIELAWSQPAQAEDGDYASSYEIWRNDVFIINVQSTQYTDVGLAEATSYQYQVYALDEVRNKSEQAAIGSFSTSTNTTPPGIVSVQPMSTDHVYVLFTEPVEETSAETTDNYQISNGVNVLAASLQDNLIAVILTTDELTLGVEYTLTVSGIRDRSVNANEIPAGTQVTFRLLNDYFENFEDGIADGWECYQAERWSVTSDEGDYSYFLNTSNYDSPGGKLLGEYALIEESVSFGSDFDLTCWAKSSENLNDNSHADLAVIFAFQDSLNYCYIQLHSYNVALNQIVSGGRTVFISSDVSVPLTTYHKIGIRFENDTVRVCINESQVLEHDLPDLESGFLGVGSYNDSAYFDDINIETLGTDETDLPPLPPTGVTVRP